MNEFDEAAVRRGWRMAYAFVFSLSPNTKACRALCDEKNLDEAIDKYNKNVLKEIS